MSILTMQHHYFLTDYNVLGWSIGEFTNVSRRDIQSEHAAGGSDDQTGERDDRNERGIIIIIVTTHLSYEVSMCS